MATQKSQTGPQGQKLPDEEKLSQSVVAARKVAEAQEAAAALKEKAKKAVNPKERMKLLQEAYDKEVEAFGQSKLAKRLSSGAWQGATAGGGIGGGVALGLGTVVGTLVSGLVSIPTVAVGGLVGTGVGLIHGPFIRFDKTKGKQGTSPEEEKQAQAMKEAERLDQAVEKGASTVPQPPKLEEEETLPDSADNPSNSTLLESQAVKRKPRKLQVRSANEIIPEPERKKPRKLQVRSGTENS